MSEDPAAGRVLTRLEDHVATLTLSRPPHNFVDPAFLEVIADALDSLDAEPQCRAVVLVADGRSFCAGADFSAMNAGGKRPDSSAIYAQAMRLYRTKKPIVAAIQGAAIGAGVGLALACDFRLASATARFSVNFNRLGFHPGFGLSYTLPRLIGAGRAARLFYTGERLSAEQALAFGIVDELVPTEDLRARAHALAAEIAASAPAAVQSTRATLRAGMAEAIQAANAHELEVQNLEFEMDDFREGVRAAAERQTPRFTGT